MAGTVCCLLKRVSMEYSSSFFDMNMYKKADNTIVAYKEYR